MPDDQKSEHIPWQNGIYRHGGIELTRALKKFPNDKIRMETVMNFGSAMRDYESSSTSERLSNDAKDIIKKALSKFFN